MMHERIRSTLSAAIITLFLAAACRPGGPLEASSPPQAPEGMVYIPGGTFTMGGKAGQADPDELPRHKVAVAPFFMDETEVTNRQFQAFVAATAYVAVAERAIDWEGMKKQLPPDTPKPPDSLLAPGALVFHPTSSPVPLGDVSQWWRWAVGADWRHPEGPGSSIEGKMDHPVVQIAWDDAVAYAEWAGKRLPTEAEWEWAALGGLEDPIYPWGNEPADQGKPRANFWQGLFPYENTQEDGFYGAAPVKNFPPNGYGLYDMAGNVWEWCADWYQAGYYRRLAEGGAAENPAGPEASFDPQEPFTPKRSMRGGSFLCNDAYCSGYRVARRMKSSPDSGLNHTGFRCVQDVR